MKIENLKLKIVFFGASPFSYVYLDALKNSGFEIVPQAEDADLGVIAYYGKIIPKAVLELPKYGFLNAHPSLLPRWRGASPVQSAILAGDKITGVTIHIATEKPDAGPILAQKKIPIEPKDTCLNLTGKLAREGAALLIPTIEKQLAGEIAPKKQDDSKATYTKLLKKKDGEIDWSKPADYIEKMVRAYSPWPGAYTRMKNGRILKIKKAEVVNGVLKPLIVQPEGKKEMPWEAFLRGHKDAIEITSRPQ
ncbi:MAG: methionyl-tRNA formyltransferase [Candidatus Giovannonibacteria bacterium]|nr:MAG: methionyl-tRNA formyltransferase [Candidatus Giovannonibacteria bacterium]